MSRIANRSTFLSLFLAWGPSSLGLAQAQASQPTKPSATKQVAAPKADVHGDHDAMSDEAEAENAKANEPPKTVTPEDEARRKQVIVKVEGVEITLGKVEDYLAQQSPILRGRYQKPEELKKLVDNMVRFELLAAEAERRGYGKHKTVVRTVKDSAVQSLLRDDVEEKVTPQSIAADEVKAYYETNAAEFHRKATRRASHILVETEAEAKQVLAEAQKSDARGFIELAKKHSKDLETKLRGGDLGFFAKEPVQGGTEVNVLPAIRKAAFELKSVGDTAPKPVAVEGGFSIVRLTGERPERHTSLEEAEHPIRTKLWREKRQKGLTDLIESLRAREKPKVNADKVDLVKLEDMDKQPEGFSPEPRTNPHLGKARPGGPHP